MNKQQKRDYILSVLQSLTNSAEDKKNLESLDYNQLSALYRQITGKEQSRFEFTIPK